MSVASGGGTAAVKEKGNVTTGPAAPGTVGRTRVADDSPNVMGGTPVPPPRRLNGDCLAAGAAVNVGATYGLTESSEGSTELT
jgi:hypothetical protein